MNEAYSNRPTPGSGMPARVSVVEGLEAIDSEILGNSASIDPFAKPGAWKDRLKARKKPRFLEDNPNGVKPFYDPKKSFLKHPHGL